MAISLAAIRAEKGMTQADVAKALGVSLPVYNAWERLSLDDIKRIAEILSVQVDTIRVPK